MKKALCYFIQFSWGIVQNLIGLIVFIFAGLAARKYYRTYDIAFISHVSNSFGGSVSLGLFIFVSNRNEELIKHEYGHTIQSLILGPFWFFVIGIPSFVWATFFSGYRMKHNVSYYKFYTEKWANKLGRADEKLIIE